MSVVFSIRRSLEPETEPNGLCPDEVVRVVGLEPTRFNPQEPKSCVSANSTIPANLPIYNTIFAPACQRLVDFIPALRYSYTIFIM